MISTKEKKEWILNNCIDELGNLNLNGLDFSDFDGYVDISNMRVKGDLHQCFQKVEGDLHQCSQTVEGDLYQGFQKVKGDLNQGFQKVEGGMYLQDTSNLSKFANNHGIAYYREIPEMTLEELEKIVGYKFKLKETVLL